MAKCEQNTKEKKYQPKKIKGSSAQEKGADDNDQKRCIFYDIQNSTWNFLPFLQQCLIDIKGEHSQIHLKKSAKQTVGNIIMMFDPKIHIAEAYYEISKTQDTKNAAEQIKGVLSQFLE